MEKRAGRALTATPGPVTARSDGKRRKGTAEMRGKERVNRGKKRRKLPKVDVNTVGKFLAEVRLYTLKTEHGDDKNITI